jgi:HlyD family secretion protein
MKRKHWILGAVAVAALGAAFVWAFRPAPIPVESATVKRAPFEQTIDEDGKTRVRERYVISAPLAGRVARIALDPGDTVTAGKPVAAIAPSVPALLDARTVRELEERVGSAQAAQAQSRAEEARIAAALEQARADLARQNQLQAEGFLSPAARDQAQLAVRVNTQALEAARSARDAAEHNVAQARAALARVRVEPVERGGRAAAQALPVIAPVSGRVLRVMQESEGVVAMGAPLVEVAELRDLEIVVDVLSTDATRIASGMPVRIEAGSSLRFEGFVRRVEPGAFTKVSALGVEEQRVNVIIDIAPGTPGIAALGDGYRVDVRIVTLRRADAVVVPVAALFRQDGGWSAFVVAGGRAQRRAVTLGGRTANEALIEQGLAPGDEVVAYPSDLLADGKRVEVVRRSR